MGEDGSRPLDAVVRTPEGVANAYREFVAGGWPRFRVIRHMVGRAVLHPSALPGRDVSTANAFFTLFL